MRKALLAIPLFAAAITSFISCNNQVGKESSKSSTTIETEKTNPIDSNLTKSENATSSSSETEDALPDQFSWANDSVRSNLKLSKNELIGFSVKDGIIAWIWDDQINTDTASYLVCHLGHHMEEPDHSDPRFATDGWFYVDTLTRRVYEYDVANDSLISLR